MDALTLRGQESRARTEEVAAASFVMVSLKALVLGKGTQCAPCAREAGLVPLRGRRGGGEGALSPSPPSTSP